MMQVAYVSAGHGSHPKAPPPVSSLLKQYIKHGLIVQDLIDKLNENYFSAAGAYNSAVLASAELHLSTMQSLYYQMTDIEQEIVEGSHMPYQKVLALQNHIALVKQDPIDYQRLTDLSEALYDQKEFTPCSLH